MSAKGFSLIEALITAFVLGTVTVAVTGLSLLSTRSAIESERANVAQGIANQEIETVRTYSYDDVAYTNAGGKIEHEKGVIENDQTYHVLTVITLKDFPENGTVQELTEETADAKQVSVEVSWERTSGGQETSTSSTVVAATFIANKLNASAGACSPGAFECETDEACDPGTPASCPDAQGNPTLDCPVTGYCAGDQPAACPTSGNCDDVGTVDPPPPPGSEPPAQPCSGSGQCASGSQCTSGFCEPVWCQNLEPGQVTAEVCSFEGCEDGIDNDGDGGIDVFGVDGDNDGVLGGPFDTPPDEQCVRMFNEGGIIEWRYECVPNNPQDPNDCSGTQYGDRYGSTTLVCSTAEQCGRVGGFASRDCTVPDCPGPNKCQVRYGCDDSTQTCLPGGGEWDYCVDDPNSCPGGSECIEGVCHPGCTFDQECKAWGEDFFCGNGICRTNKNYCSGKYAVCHLGQCYQCTVDETEHCADVNPELCGDPNNPPPGGERVCSWGQCAQCNSVPPDGQSATVDDCCESDPTHEKNYCKQGKCVECITNQNCIDSQDPPPLGQTWVCEDNACELFGAPQTQCSDNQDNDTPPDGRVDEGDPCCHDDLDESDGDDTYNPALLIEQCELACDDTQDNDGDGLVDCADPGCHPGGGACSRGWASEVGVGPPPPPPPPPPLGP